MQALYLRLLAAVTGFTVWTLFSLPLLTGRAGIHEAWDSPAYWNRAIPLLLLLALTAGWFSRDLPWKLALSALAGHFLGVALIKQPTTDFGLLPLSMLLVGLPGLAALSLAIWLGQSMRLFFKPPD